ARLGHLLLHREQGHAAEPAASRAGDCEAVVRQTLRDEAEAHGLELELRRALDAPTGPHAFPFAQAYWSAPPHRRIDLLQSYFESHPDGAPAIPGFAQEARRRCEKARAR
ncbi:MAG: hypothetical protein JRI23_21405, partial [Deltaproteobacteria bacterium]|nr:hypothetical protein [Deltaproteobacteria bacterium]MBW2534499.1 hypothetical protein [Deltaproteobacteria bacterium]